MLPWPHKMDSGVVEKCLAFCQALVTTNQTFSFNLTISKDNFNFTNKELQGSSCRGKKKSPSQVRSEDRRRKEREKIQCDVTENVAENSVPEISDYTCNQCEEKFKTEKGLKIHIGRMHKEDCLQSTPEKERVVIEEEPSLNIIPIKEVRDEPHSEEQSGSQLVCTMCKALWGPLTRPCYNSASYVDRTRWNCLGSRCWMKSTTCPKDYRLCE